MNHRLFWLKLTIMQPSDTNPTESKKDHIGCIRWFTELKHGDFPWQTVSHNQMVHKMDLSSVTRAAFDLCRPWFCPRKWSDHVRLGRLRWSQELFRRGAKPGFIG